MLRTCDWSQEMGWWAEGAGPEDPSCGMRCHLQAESMGPELSLASGHPVLETPTG